MRFRIVLAILLTLIVINIAGASYSDNDLALLSPSSLVYNITGDHETVEFSVDYENNYNNKIKTIIQVDDNAVEVRNSNFVTAYQNPEFTQEGMMLLPSKIQNWIIYNFTLYLTEKKGFSLGMSNSESDENVKIVYYGNNSLNKGWFCNNNGKLKSISINDTVYYDMSIVVKNNGIYYDSYEIYVEGKLISKCSIEPNKLRYIDTIKLVNQNQEKIITKQEILSGTYSFSLDPGEHYIYLYSYNKDKKLYNISKKLFVVINDCGDMRCDNEEVCEYDCTEIGYPNMKNFSFQNSESENSTEIQQEEKKGTAINKKLFSITIDSEDRILKENNKAYLLYDLEKNQYAADIIISAFENADVDITDTYFVKPLTNISDVISVEMNNEKFEGPLHLVAGQTYRISVRLRNIKSLKYGESYGTVNFGDNEKLEYKAIMPKDLYKRLHGSVPKTEGDGFSLNISWNKIFNENLLYLLCAVIIIAAIIIIIRYFRKKREKAVFSIKQKYGIDIEL